MSSPFIASWIGSNPAIDPIPLRITSNVSRMSLSKISWRSQPSLNRAVPPSHWKIGLNDVLDDVARGVGEGLLADQAAVDERLGQVLGLADVARAPRPARPAEIFPR